MDSGLRLTSRDRWIGALNMGGLGVPKLRSAAPFLGLAAVVLIFAMLSGSPERYLSIPNIRIVLSQTLIVALGAIGMTLIIVSGGIDLSVGSTIALAGVVTALGLRQQWPPLAALLAGVLVAVVAGALNGITITLLRVVP